MIDKKEKFVSLVIYIHNDESIVGDSMKVIYDVIDAEFKHFEIIVVNDNSDDNSVKYINTFAEKASCPVRIIDMGYYHGLERAIQAGVDVAIGDFVFEIDSLYIDYSPNLFLELYQKAEDGFDIVSARPHRAKTWQSKVFYQLLNFTLRDAQISSEAFRILSRRGINRVKSISTTTHYRKLVYAYSGLNTTSIQYDAKPLATSKQKYGKRAVSDRRNTAVDTFIVFTDIAYRISMIFSILMALLAFGTGIYVMASYFFLEQLVEGWAPIMGLMSAGFCGVFIIIMVVTKYLDIILRGMFNRHAYLISSIKKIS